MEITKIYSDALEAAAGKIPEHKPVQMLNLVRYKKQADYKDLFLSEDISGKQVYLNNYIPAFKDVAADLGISGVKVLFVGNVLANLTTPVYENWDDIVIIEYPTYYAFRSIFESSAYGEKAAPFRRAALADWRLIATVKSDAQN